MFLNKVILIGRLTRDPDYKQTPNGIPVCSLSLAVPRRYTSGAGEKKEETLFINIEAWQKQADIASRFLKKGRRVLIEGRLVQDQWIAPTGEKRSRIKVIAQRVQFMDREAAYAPEQYAAPQETYQQTYTPLTQDVSEIQEEIPEEPLEDE